MKMWLGMWQEATRTRQLGEWTLEAWLHCCFQMYKRWFPAALGSLRKKWGNGFTAEPKEFRKKEKNFLTLTRVAEASYRRILFFIIKTISLLCRIGKMNLTASSQPSKPHLQQLCWKNIRKGCGLCRAPWCLPLGSVTLAAIHPMQASPHPGASEQN